MASNSNARSAGVAKFLDSLSDDVRGRVEQLRQVQSKCDVVKREFLKESKALEEKFRKLFDPLYQERYSLIVGSEESGGAEQTGEEPGRVPGFWLRVLKSADLVGGNVSRRDEPILKYLLDISHGPLDDGKPGFKLVFKFAPNPYFQPTVLEKRYFMGGDDETVLEKTEGTTITWMLDKNPGYKIVKKKTRPGEEQKTKVVQTHSFFDFFSAPMVPDTGNAEDISEIVELLAEDDLEMGCCIKEMLIPSAVSWYTGEMGVDAVVDRGNGSDEYSGSEEDEDSSEED